MLMNLASRIAVLAGLLVLLPSLATAIPYTFTSGSASVRATLAGTTTSVLEGPIPVIVPLGGSFVDFDAGLGANGTITGLELSALSNFTLDLDQTLVGFDLIDVSGATLTNAVGASAGISGSGSFFLDTVVNAIIEGIGGPPPSVPVTSTTSAAAGTLGISGDSVNLGIVGVNLATFESLVTPGQYIEVKADFTFFGTVVPEPGTALLLGLGLLGLSAARRPEGDAL